MLRFLNSSIVSKSILLLCPKKIRLGLEYNQYESWNDAAEEGNRGLETQSINSLYANYSISDKLDVFAKHLTHVQIPH